MAEEKKLSIVERIVTFLELNDAGKLQAFFKREAKKLKRDIKGNEKNLDTLGFNHEQGMEELAEKLEDAELRLENAYLSVDMDSIKTNEAQESFSRQYWVSIELAEKAVQEIKTQVKDREEAFNNEKEDIEAQIKEIKYRIKKIS